MLHCCLVCGHFYFLPQEHLTGRQNTQNVLFTDVLASSVFSDHVLVFGFNKMGSISLIRYWRVESFTNFTGGLRTASDVIQLPFDNPGVQYSLTSKWD